MFVSTKASHIQLSHRMLQQDLTEEQDRRKKLEAELAASMKAKSDMEEKASGVLGKIEELETDVSTCFL